MSHSAFPKLFEPITINGVELKNRIAMSPLCTRMATPTGEVTRQEIEYFRRRARGGVGLVIVEYAHVDDKCSKSADSQLGAYSDRLIPGLNELAEAIQGQGPKTFLQICHGGRITTATRLGGVLPIAPSAIPCSFVSGLLGHPNWVREATVEELQGVCAAFAAAAGRAKRAGFDGVELHGTHGYLLASFVSPRTNKRTDMYGGDISGRASFPLQVVRAVRETIGSDFPLSYRMTGTEFLDDGTTSEDAVVFATLLEEAGVDVLHVSGTNFETLHKLITPLYVKSGNLVPFVAAVKRSVNVPVIAVGAGFSDPAMCEDVLATGKADMVAVGRQLLADPDFPLKAAAGAAHQIRPCIRCNDGCMGRFYKGLTQRCSVNYETGHELDRRVSAPIRADERSGNMVVVGGGVAGMEGARVGALLGYNVTLLEKKAELGGMVVVGSLPDFKTDLRRLLVWYETTLRDLGVKIVLGHEADEGAVQDLSPDLLFVAVGAEPYVPPLRGIDLPHVVDCADALRRGDELGGPVVVCGGGMVGCEVAVHLASKNKEVVLVEMLPQVASDCDPQSHDELMEMLERSKTRVLMDWEVVEITRDAVIGRHHGRLQSITADSVVIALSMKSHDDVLPRLAPLAPLAIAAGDCVRPGRIGDAIHDAANKMLNLREAAALS